MQMMSLEDIISEIRRLGLVPSDFGYRKLTGGTSSLVALLEGEGYTYVVKSNFPAILQAESAFLLTYAHIGLLPTVQYVDPHYRFFLMEYLSSDEQSPLVQKKTWLPFLVQQVINQYKAGPNADHWGWVDEPQSSWESFLNLRALAAHDTIGERLPQEDFHLVCTLVSRAASRQQAAQPYLLHGDLGVHNLLFQQGQINGLIDPTPVSGGPIYDLVYAFCSSPYDLSPETIKHAAAQLSAWNPQQESDLYEEVLLGLYYRISTCIKCHPHDLPAYLDAWQAWKRAYFDLERRGQS